AQLRVPARRASAHANAGDPTRAGVVGDLEDRAHLDHGLSLRLRQDLAEAPPLQLRERTGLLDPHAVADLRDARFVVRVEAARPLDRPVVARLLNTALDLDDDGLRHLVRDHASDLRLASSGG